MIEYRQIAEMRADKDTLHGLVTPFNSWTTIGAGQKGSFRERIAPGTFAKTLQEQDVVLIHSHNTAMPMARTSIPAGQVGHFDLREDVAAGLRAKAVPTQTSYAKDVLINADAGVIRGMSFGFEVIKDDWTDDEGRASDSTYGTQRTIREVRLHECTTTAFPAYKDTQLSARDETSALLEARAAKASYADTATCADCGATEQYGSFCAGCGGDMSAVKAKGKGKTFCTSCGSKRDDGHECEKAGDVLLDAAARVISIVNELPEAQREARITEVREGPYEQFQLTERGVVQSADYMISILPEDKRAWAANEIAERHGLTTNYEAPEPAATTQDTEASRDDDAEYTARVMRAIYEV